MSSVILRRAALAVMAMAVFGQSPPAPRTPALPAVFEAPLLPVDGVETPSERADLTTALEAYERSGLADALEPLEGFLSAHPGSRWRIGLRMNMGLALRRTGWPGAAARQFEMAWRDAKADPEDPGRWIADRAVTEWMGLCVKAGDDQTLERLLKETEGRPMRGGTAQRRLDAARALHAMQKEPKFYLCGPTALATVKAVMKPGRAVDPRDVKDTIPGPGGTSLFQLAMMATNWDIPLQMLKRAPGSKVLTPSVLHWKTGHWAAVVAEAGGRYLVREDVLEEAQWVRREALDAETSGYCLGPHVPLPEGWTRVGAEEGRNVWGRGRVGLGPWYGPYADSLTRPRLDPAPPVAQAGVRMGNLSLEVWFAPLSIPSPSGPAWPFELRYQQRATSEADHPGHAHLGAHWSFSGLSYVIEDPGFEWQDAYLVTESGGWLRFTGFDPATGRYARNTQTLDLLVRRAAGRYELHRPDGVVETFAHRAAGGPALRRVFRTEQAFPQGSKRHFTFDESHRLTRMDKDSGRWFALQYEDGQHPQRLTRVKDNLGRETAFEFDRQGRLMSVVDAAGMRTRLTYGEGVTDPDVLRGLTTPEGTWTFECGQKDLSRWVEWVDPEKQRHRAEFRHDAPGLPVSDAVVPAGPLNQYMHDRGTYYWSPAVLARHGTDYREAEAIRYLFNPTQLALSWNLESIKEAGAPRTWFLYSGQSNTQVSGAFPKPRWIGRKASSEEERLDLHWDGMGRLISARGERGGGIQWIYPDGPGHQPLTLNQHRPSAQWLWEVDDAGRLLALRKGGRTAWKAEWDAQGRPTQVIDAQGRTWRLIYDPSGRWTGIQGPATFHWTFDHLGRVATVQEGRGKPVLLSYDPWGRMLVGVPQRAVRTNGPNRSLLTWVTLPRPELPLPYPSVIRAWLVLPPDGPKVLGLAGTRGGTFRNAKASQVAKWLAVLRGLMPDWAPLGSRLMGG